MTNRESYRSTTATAFEPSHRVLEELVFHLKPTADEQQDHMALAAMTAPGRSPAGGLSEPPWIVVADERAGPRRGASEAADRGVVQTLRCPYCRSMTYDVRISAHTQGFLAVGVCSQCGTRGESVRPRRSG